MQGQSRRARSISYLVEHDVPYIDHLPDVVGADEPTLRRSSIEVGLRTICLALVSMKGAGGDHDFVIEGAHHYGVIDDFSPNEKRFLFDKTPTEHEKLQFSWRTEAAHALLWAVKLVDQLSFPSGPCDWNAFWEGFHNNDRETFLESLNLREQSVLLDEADLIYRLHWAARDADLKGREPPANLSIDVVVERHHALNWLIVPPDEPYPWDGVPTDT